MDSRSFYGRLENQLQLACDTIYSRFTTPLVDSYVNSTVQPHAEMGIGGAEKTASKYAKLAYAPLLVLAHRFLKRWYVMVRLMRRHQLGTCIIQMASESE